MTAKPVAAILSPNLDIRLGGVERFAYSLQGALAQIFDVRIRTSQSSPGKALRRSGLKYLWESRISTRQFHSKSAYELVITNGTLGWGIPDDVPRIHVLHGTMARSMKLNTSLRMRERIASGVGGALAELMSSRHAVTVAVAQRVADEARCLYGVRVNHVIENGVDTDLFRPRDRIAARRTLGLPGVGKLALFVGRAEPRKGIDIAVAASRAAGFQLLVAGARPVTDAVNLGLMSPEQLTCAYAAADCVLFPTRYEACSYVVLEALASGTPLVTTPVGWSSDLPQRVPGYGALLAAPTVKLMTNALHFVADGDPATLEGLVSRARQYICRENSLATFSAQWAELAEAVARI